MNRRLASLTILAAIALAPAAPALAHDDGHGHDHPHAPAGHGGQVQTIGGYEGELVVEGSDLTLYVHDESCKPVDVAKMSAAAIVLAKGGRKTVEMKPAGENKLAGKVGFAPAEGKFRATVTLNEGAVEIGNARYSLGTSEP